ncbi:hypothetical protein HDK77DRAFT_183028 [Phyllosticta capitalensis]|uniref:uncharacterized protein n=1 Tax=Phyllosticta capitalensis TaxID=121624 RepID=UPI0031318F0C
MGTGRREVWDLGLAAKTCLTRGLLRQELLESHPGLARKVLGSPDWVDQEQELEDLRLKKAARTERLRARPGRSTEQAPEQGQPEGGGGRTENDVQRRQADAQGEVEWQSKENVSPVTVVRLHGLQNYIRPGARRGRVGLAVQQNKRRNHAHEVLDRDCCSTIQYMRQRALAQRECGERLWTRRPADFPTLLPRAGPRGRAIAGRRGVERRRWRLACLLGWVGGLSC